MKKGSKAIFTCPSDVAYGKRAMGPIPADATLKFDVELVDFEGSEPPKKTEQVNSESKDSKSQDIDTTKFSVSIYQEGEGPTVTSGTRVKAHYTGTLLDGTKFDSSRDRGQPLDFVIGVGQVIKCWDDGFLQMKKGSKAIFNCPSDVAYGKRAMGPIPADATLQFDVELVDFESSEPPKKAEKEESEQEKDDQKLNALDEKVGELIDKTKFSVKIYQEGEGPTVTSGTKVKAHYTGTLLDGTKFDSSLDRGQPLDFAVGTGRVIKCWDDGFLQMKKGSKAIFTCPPEIAYGSRARGKIPANATLQFDVELVDF